jgi:indolepyruvate ferredoxin oxidoreductase beta subunit
MPDPQGRIVLAGVGGQGVIFASRLLAEAALAAGAQVMVSESHGMSQRGGSVAAHLIIGDEPGPLIRRGTADTLIALDRLEGLRHLPVLRPGGAVFINAVEGFPEPVRARLDELGVSVCQLDADGEALRLGSPAIANVVLLGFLAAHTSLGLSLDDLKHAVRGLGPPPAVKINCSALEEGARNANHPDHGHCARLWPLSVTLEQASR